MRLPRVGPLAFLRFAQTSLVLVVVNIVSGGAVRLTDSGLGCPDWPTCSARAVTPALSFHPLMEFGNRMVVVALCVVLGATLVAAWRRAPRRRDLVWLSAGLVGGVVGEAVVGAIVVYSKLNPYVVMCHFLLGMALLSVALVLALRAGRAPGPARALVDRRCRRAAVGLLVVLGTAIAAGTATTGAGPHAGGPDAVRVPVPLDDMARTHSGVVLVAGALLLAELALLYRSGAPEAVQRRGRVLLAVMIAQGTVGYVQFFLHLPALLVGIHIFGATMVWSAALWFVDGLFARVPEVVARPSPPSTLPSPVGAPGDTRVGTAPVVARR